MHDTRARRTRSIRRPAPAFSSFVYLVVAWLGGTAPDVALASDALSGKPSEGLVFSVQSGDEGQGLDLWRARISDGALQRLSITDELDERWPRWSQEAGLIAFLQRNLTGLMSSTIMLLDPESGERRNVRANPDLSQRSHAWSPDGRFVAHTFRVPPTSAKEKTNAGTAVVDIAKGEREIVSESEEVGYRMQSLAYAHDGTRIVGHGRNPTLSTDDKMWLLTPGKRPKAVPGIPRGVYDSPTFTPDNKAILFDYRQVRGNPRDLMRIELGPGKRAKRIASTARSDDHSAVVSPARNEMVIVTDIVGNDNLALVDLETGKKKYLTKDLVRVATSPVWSPDGERIAYVSIPNRLHEKSEKKFDQYRVHVIDRTGKQLFEATGTMPSFMPPWKGNQPVASFAKSEGQK